MKTVIAVTFCLAIVILAIAEDAEAGFTSRRGSSGGQHGGTGGTPSVCECRFDNDCRRYGRNQACRDGCNCSRQGSSGACECRFNSDCQRYGGNKVCRDGCNCSNPRIDVG